MSLAIHSPRFFALALSATRLLIELRHLVAVSRGDHANDNRGWA